jgi:hypothetical protein
VPHEEPESESRRVQLRDRRERDRRSADERPPPDAQGGKESGAVDEREEGIEVPEQDRDRERQHERDDGDRRGHGSDGLDPRREEPAEPGHDRDQTGGREQTEPGERRAEGNACHERGGLADWRRIGIEEPDSLRSRARDDLGVVWRTAGRDVPAGSQHEFQVEARARRLGREEREREPGEPAPGRDCQTGPQRRRNAESRSASGGQRRHRPSRPGGRPAASRPMSW